ncbi:GNAT family N-acetyltransferase [Sporosarcina sp.]|uniref:GNAT family N-acetyltransferase n=1 Tax=Sporosarcina sp. TaxID=49982 RepID=UPI0026183B95|nr:GNAT family N-acetyltransferase [Sporosarcina sp.]
MNIKYKINSGITPEELANVFMLSGIKRPYNDLSRLKKMIDNSDVIVEAWVEQELIGIARSITDYSYCAYLSDLAVKQPFQGKGIGKELLKITKTQFGKQVAIILLSSPGAMEFYPLQGYEKVENGFRIPREI